MCSLENLGIHQAPVLWAAGPWLLMALVRCELALGYSLLGLMLRGPQHPEIDQVLLQSHVSERRELKLQRAGVVALKPSSAH